MKLMFPRFIRLIAFAILPLLLGASDCGAAAPTKTSRIVPLQTDITFSSQPKPTLWSVPIQSPNGRTAYTLSLHVSYWVWGQVEGVELVLRRGSNKSQTGNLLEPTGHWHGLQDYMFPANGFVNGLQGFKFGDRRAIRLPKLGLILQITVQDAKVSAILGRGENQLDSLSLQVEVDNLNR
jgi:hypothetical protein